MLLVAAREFRSAAKRPSTYRIRWATALIGFVLLLWLVWVNDAHKNVASIPRVFEAMSYTAFFYCLLVSAARSADAISSERREGTLGLLFLADLTTIEILAGKVVTNAAATCYGLMAVLPMLALPMLLGGITFEHFARTTLALLNAMWIGTAIGFAISVVCTRQYVAVGVALFTGLLATAGLEVAASLLGYYKLPALCVRAAKLLNPMFPIGSPQWVPRPNQWEFWISVGLVHLIGWLILGWVTFELARSWRDAAGLHTAIQSAKTRISGAKGGRSLRQASWRTRLLNINPYLWLSDRRRVASLLFLIVGGTLIAFNALMISGMIGARFKNGPAFGTLIGHMLSWFGLGCILHLWAAYHAAVVSSHRVAEDRQTGALELILSTPLGVRDISKGLWLASARAMLVPAILTTLVHLFFLRHVIELFLSEHHLRSPHSPPPSSMAGICFDAFLMPLSAHSTNTWPLYFSTRILILAWMMLATNWIALSWVGRWLGLRMKQSGLAPLAALGLVTIPPWIAFGVACYVLDEAGFFRGPEAETLPLGLWLATFFGFGHAIVMSLWARNRWHQYLKVVVTENEGFKERPIQWRTVFRWSLRFAAAAGVLLLLGILAHFNSVQRAKRDWERTRIGFEGEGPRKTVAHLLPPVPGDELNFARTAAYTNWVAHGTNLPSAISDRAVSLLQPTTLTFPWTQSKKSDLRLQLGEFSSRNLRNPSSATNSDAVLESLLRPLSPMLEEVLKVSRTHTLVAESVDRTHRAVFEREASVLHHFLRMAVVLSLRSSARVSMGKPEEAAEDFLSTLRLARILSTSTDHQSSTAVHGMLCLALQPLFDGLLLHRWSTHQLVQFRDALASFDLLHLNSQAVRRIVHAHVDRVLSNDPSPRGFRQFSDSAISRYRRITDLYELAKVALSSRNPDTQYIGDLTALWGVLHQTGLDGNSIQLIVQAPWQPRSPLSVAFVQTSVNQAITACELERFRQQHGEYPVELKSLVNQFPSGIPRDASRGLPLFYRPLSNGLFELRGAGPNFNIDLPKSGTQGDDWVWSYEAITP